MSAPAPAPVFVDWFRSVAPYIHKFRDQTFVVGVPGEAIAEGYLSTIVQDLALIQSMGVQIVMVHGFRPQINEQLEAKHLQSVFSHGVRLTDSAALDAAQEAAGQLRFEIEAAFSQGLPNTPMADSTVRVISGNFITARPMGIVDGVDFKHSGVVRKVDTAVIRRTLDNFLEADRPADRGGDPLFAMMEDLGPWNGDAPADLAAKHDDYLYGK